MNPRSPVAALCLLAMFATACDQDSRVTRYRPPLAGLSGAQTATAPVGGNVRELTSPDSLEPSRLVIDKPDGGKVLVRTTVRHLMAHIERTLDEDEDTVFIDQILSTQTLDHLREQGYQPQDYVDYLKERRRDIALFFARMPMGERSPTVIFESTGRRQFVVRLTGAATNNVPFTKLWVALDSTGQFRLVWLS